MFPDPTEMVSVNCRRQAKGEKFVQIKFGIGGGSSQRSQILTKSWLKPLR